MQRMVRIRVYRCIKDAGASGENHMRVREFACVTHVRMGATREASKISRMRCISSANTSGVDTA